MQIVIDISEDDYQFIKDVEFQNPAITERLYHAIYHGTIYQNDVESEEKGCK